MESHHFIISVAQNAPSVFYKIQQGHPRGQDGICRFVFVGTSMEHLNEKGKFNMCAAHAIGVSRYLASPVS